MSMICCVPLFDGGNWNAHLPMTETVVAPFRKRGPVTKYMDHQISITATSWVRTENEKNRIAITSQVWLNQFQVVRQSSLHVAFPHQEFSGWWRIEVSRANIYRHTGDFVMLAAVSIKRGTTEIFSNPTFWLAWAVTRGENHSHLAIHCPHYDVQVTVPRYVVR